MATIDDLADRLQGFFAAKFPPGEGDGPGTVLLVFDALGTPLSPDEFVGSGTDAAKDILAHQAAARLADQLPAANLLEAGWFLAKAGSRLSNWYGQIVNGATAAATDEPTISGFEALKAAAANDLRQNTLISATGTVIGGGGGTVDASGTHDTYYATSMSPVDWYEESAACWQHYDLHSADQPPPAPSIPIDHPRFSFRVVKDLESQDLTKFVARAVTVAPVEPSTVGPHHGELLMSAVRDFPVRRFAPALAAAAGRPQFSRFLVSDDTPVASAAAVAVAESPSAAVAQPMILSSRFSAEALRPHVDLSQIGAMQIDPLLVHEATTAETPTSDNFEVSFDYCLVRFDRPWWAEIMLLSHQWKLPGFGPGDIASGSAKTPSGPVTLITIGSVVVKNLKIGAHWSDSDKAALAGSTSLGPFCIAGADYDSSSGTISRDGMQVIAWLCQVPPMLPPSPV